MMNDWQQVVKILKDTDNKQSVTACTGIITSLTPFVIQLNEYILIDDSKLMLTAYFDSLTKSVNDKVLLIATSDMQKFFVIDKVV